MGWCKWYDDFKPTNGSTTSKQGDAVYIKRWVCDCNKSELTPTGTELLDGVNAAYVINKPYEGIQVWSDGIEWFIIQKKGITKIQIKLI